MQIGASKSGCHNDYVVKPRSEYNRRGGGKQEAQCLT